MTHRAVWIKLQIIVFG